MPVRIQRKRTRGWKMPPNCIYVGRPTKFGNMFMIGKWYQIGDGHLGYSFRECPIDTPEKPHDYFYIKDAEIAVDWFRKYRDLYPLTQKEIQEIRGKDLACWCSLCEKHKDGLPLGVKCSACSPCHVDILLDMAKT